jgi:diadenosine tetraphosphatase ApaH/serine/threonine PP2A family protein phosphatase
MARKRLSRKVTWWLGEQTQKRLVTWTRLLLLPVRRFYQVLLQNTGTGYHNWVSCIIQANCQMIANEPVKVQFELTQGILAHEAGHARYTDHATHHGPLLHQVINLLDDQRIEDAMVTSLPALESTFLLLRKHMWKRTIPVSGSPNYQALDLCLDWRFANHFVDEGTMLDQAQRAS